MSFKLFIRIIIIVYILQNCQAIHKAFFVTSEFRGCDVTCDYEAYTPIDSEELRYSNCTGKIDDPMDNINNILVLAYCIGNIDSLTIILLPDGDHFMLLAEYIPRTTIFSGNAPIRSSNGFRFPASNLKLMPLLCSQMTEFINGSIPNINCLKDNEQLVIYMKWNFFYEIQNSLEIHNIIIDGSESLYQYYANKSNDTFFHYPETTDLKYCLYTRVKCCNNSLNGVSYINSSIKCAHDTNFFAYAPNIYALSSNFELVKFEKMNINNTIIRNYYGFIAYSLIQIASISSTSMTNQFNISIINSKFLNNFLPNAIFYLASSTTFNHIIIANCTVLNIYPNSTKYFSIFPGVSDQMHSNQYLINIGIINIFNISDTIFYTNNEYALMTIGNVKNLIWSNVSFTNINQSEQREYLQMNLIPLVFKNNAIKDIENFANMSLIPLYGISIQFDILDQLKFNKVNFIGIASVLGTLVFQANSQLKSINSANITIFNCKFYNNTSFGGSSLRIITNINDKSDYYITIVNTTFSYNKAFILTKNQSCYSYYQYYYFTLVEQEFISGYGGAILINYEIDTDNFSQNTRKIIFINSSNFINNSATLAGGAIYSDLYPVNIDLETTFFNNNIAIYGPNIASLPIYFGLLTNELFNENIPYYQYREYIDKLIQKSNTLDLIIRSGYLETPIEFGIFDIYGQIISIDNSSIITLKAINDSEEQFFAIPSSIKASQGIFSFTNTSIFKYYPGKNIQIQVIKNGINEKYGMELPKTSLNIINLSFRLCILGEIFSDNACTKCDQGTYSLSLDPFFSGPCQLCNNKESICLGGSQVLPLQGYWIKNQTADIMHLCPLKDACLGYSSDKLFDYKNCKVGYEGNLCNTCQSGYGKSLNGNDCIECSSSSNITYYFELIFAIILQIIIFLMIVLPSIDQSKSINKQELNARKITYMKILVDFTQMNSLINNVIHNMPNISSQFYFFMDLISFSLFQLFQIDCLFDSSIKDNNFFIYVTLLIILLIVIIIILMICYILPIQKWFKINKDILIIISTILVIYYQQTLLLAVFSFYQCINLYRNDISEYYIIQSLDTQCWTEGYWKWTLPLSILVILIWGISIPFLIGWILYKHSNNSQQLPYRFSFLTIGYRLDNMITRGWEIYYMLKKLILVVIMMLIPYVSSQYALIIAGWIILLSIILQSYLNPFNDSLSNRLEVLSLLLSHINYLAGACFLVKLDNDNINQIISVITIILSSSFLACWAFSYFKLFIFGLKHSKIKLLIIRIFGKPENLQDNVEFEDIIPENNIMNSVVPQFMKEIRFDNSINNNNDNHSNSVLSPWNNSLSTQIQNNNNNNNTSMSKFFKKKHYKSNNEKIQQKEQQHDRHKVNKTSKKQIITRIYPEALDSTDNILN